MWVSEAEQERADVEAIYAEFGEPNVKPVKPYFFSVGFGEAKVKQLREETAPVIARFMEAEVLRSQIQAWPWRFFGGLGWGLAASPQQVCSEDLVRLKQEVVACKEELKEGISEFEFFGNTAAM